MGDAGDRQFSGDEGTCNKVFMRTNFSFSVLLILAAVFCLGSSGCYTTTYVFRRGVIKEKFSETREVVKAPDGTIALKVDAFYYKEGFGFILPEEVVVRRAQRFVVGTPEAVAQAARQQGFSRAYVPLLRGMEGEGWQICPPAFFAPDACLEDLSDSLSKQGEQFKGDAAVPYEIEGILRHISFEGAMTGQYRRSRRQWWSYPVQIFLVPAIAFDIATSPVQFFYCCGIERGKVE
jgi:hypothetical protein